MIVPMGGAPKQGEKVFYKIGEVATLTKLPAYVLRFWESEFNFLKPQKSRGKHRAYTQTDIETILEIKKMLYEEGYTIAGLKRHWYRRKRTGEKPGLSSEGVKKVRAELRSILTKLGSHGT
jgi:DNA-binding transcriptional MerR regulator